MNQSRKNSSKRGEKISNDFSPRQIIFSSRPIQLFQKFDPFILFIVFISLILRILIPANVFTNTPHDDLLGIQLARNLLNGDWLGAWDNRTLLKPPGYSYFLFACHFLPIEPQVVLHIIYLCSAAYFIWIIKRVFPVNSGSISILRLTFMLMAFNPMFFSGDFSRIYRMSLNVVLVHFTILVFLHFWLILSGNSRFERLHPKFLLNKRRNIEIYFSLLIGLLYSGLVLTRSEAVWILYPALIAFCIFAAHGWLKSKGQNRWKHLSKLLLISIVTFIGYSIPVEGTKQLNAKYYNAPILENYYSGQFARAFTLWTGVQGSNPNSTFVPINASQREIVYRVSSTARYLEKSLETPPNTGWKIFNCQQSGICDETGPWFPFELRDAATQVFGINSEAKFQQVFRQIADDIEAACNTRVIKCGRSGTSTGTLNLRDIPKRLLINDMAVYFSSLSNLDQASEIVRRDGGSDPAQLAIWDSVVDIKRLYMLDDKQLFVVLGDLVANLKVFYSKVYTFLIVIFILSILIPRKKLNSYLQLRFVLVFLFSTLVLYGAGMGVFHSATNNSAGSSFYTQPAGPIFLLMLLISLNLLFAEASSTLLAEIRSKIVGNQKN